MSKVALLLDIIMLTQKSLFSGNFSDFALTEELQNGLTRLGYKQPTNVQSAVFKHVSEGSDLVVQSHTGSGKTTAFGLPVLNQLDPDNKAVQAICLAPTRELALQVATELDRLAHDSKLTVLYLRGRFDQRADRRVKTWRTVCCGGPLVALWI